MGSGREWSLRGGEGGALETKKRVAEDEEITCHPSRERCWVCVCVGVTGWEGGDGRAKIKEGREREFGC